jgi:hypothetical protein
VKKLISVGVALALLTMAIMPGVAAAQYTEPDTFAKTPFAIIESGFVLVGILLDALGGDLGLPDWLDSGLMNDIGGWAGGPLSWTVDMLGWGISLVGDVIGALDPIISPIATLPFALSDLSGIFDTIACGLFTPFGGVVAPPFDPCG